MGLDMNAHSIPKNSANTDISVVCDEEGNNGGEDLHYWRKHHDLHGWMEKLYIQKGGKNTFNCEYVRLTELDLDNLHRAIRLNKLPATTGFFFGDNPPDEESKQDDYDFIAKARQAIADGNDVYYSSWW